MIVCDYTTFMKARVLAGLLATVFFFAGATHVLAETVVDPVIFEDTVWTKEGSPYLISETVTIDPGVTLTIESGVVVQSAPGGSLFVLGRVETRGTSEEPILFTANDSQWDGILVFGGDLLLENTALTNIGNDAIDVAYGSSANLTGVLLQNVRTGIGVYEDSTADVEDLVVDGVEDSAVAAYNNSYVTLASSTIQNVSNSYGAVEVFNDSTADISDLTLSNVSGGEALSVFGNSIMTLRDSSILNTDSSNAVGIYDTSIFTATGMNLSGGSGDGVELYSGAFVDIQDSTVSGFTDGAAFTDYGDVRYGENSLVLKQNDIHSNDTGILSYSTNSTYAIADNAIHKNTSYGALLYGDETLDVSNNYWGDPSGPYNDPDNVNGKGNEVFSLSGSTILFSPWLSSWGEKEVGPSNVLFLPGIEGSRLYRPDYKGGTDKLWEPTSDGDVIDLYLNPDGSSQRFDIYTKEHDVLDTLPFPSKERIYQSLIDQMNELKSAGTINDWEPIAYDWRLSLEDILAYGNDIDGRLYYSGDLRATSTPYIMQELKRLAATSKSGKVTIIAHSNGGLVAKALLKQLEDHAATLVDRVILVGAPQSGAPIGIGALLYGYKQGISIFGFPIVHDYVARAFSQNSPMAYHLLPSEDYLESTMGDPNHPVIRFSGDGYAKEEAAYGSTIANRVALADFLLAKEGGREKPKEKDINSAEILNPDLIDYAVRTHATLDFWYPPEGIKVDQITGWGVDTVAGIDFYSPPGKSKRLYKPIFTEDGDDTVTVPSAIMMASSTDVKRYWLDIAKINKIPDTKIKYSHKDLFEIPFLEDFIKNRIKNSVAPLPQYILSSQPPSTSDKKLIFFLHSPLTLQLADSLGNVTGLAPDDSITQDIPGSTYGELGDVKYVIAPEEGEYQLTMHGQDEGTFSLDIDESVNGVVTTSSTIAEVPTTASTLATLTVASSTALSALTVDEDGDGKNDIVISPRIGETVTYEPPALPPAPQPSSGGGGAISIPIITATTTPVIPINTATSAPATSASKKVTQTKKPAIMAVAPSKKVVVVPHAPTPQTASAYDASQQSGLQKLGVAVYNELHGLWRAFKKLF